MQEILDIVDENGEPTGETVEREFAHADGIRHRTSHVWLARKRNGRAEILLQKRAENKDSYPGCYDISSAGLSMQGTAICHRHGGSLRKSWVSKREKRSCS